MLTRALPFVAVMLAACDPGNRAVKTPAAISAQDLVRAALESPGDGSDILEAVAEFETTEKWRKTPAGLVVSDSCLDAILEAHETSDRGGDSVPSVPLETNPAQEPIAVATTDLVPK